MQGKAESQKMNLAVLQRLDPNIIRVLGGAGHVALYSFDSENKAWEKKDVEGSLFIVQRSEEPQHRVFVMNRISRENFIEDLLPGFEMEVSEPYLLFRNINGDITGVWFYNKEEGKAVSNLINSITSRMSSLIEKKQKQQKKKKQQQQQKKVEKSQQMGKGGKETHKKKTTRDKRRVQPTKEVKRNTPESVTIGNAQYMGGSYNTGQELYKTNVSHKDGPCAVPQPDKPFDPETQLLKPSFFYEYPVGKQDTIAMGAFQQSLLELSHDESFMNEVMRTYTSLSRTRS